MANRWVTDIFSCFSYKENGHCLYCPFFIPMSVCGTCCMIGRIESHLRDEAIVCCGMGAAGLSLCLISTPINLFGPLGGFCWFGVNSLRLRREIAKKHQIEDDVRICCFRNPPCLTGILQFIQHFSSKRIVCRQWNMIVSRYILSSRLICCDCRYHHPVYVQINTPSYLNAIRYWYDPGIRINYIQSGVTRSDGTTGYWLCCNNSELHQGCTSSLHIPKESHLEILRLNEIERSRFLNAQFDYTEDPDCDNDVLIDEINYYENEEYDVSYNWCDNVDTK